MMATDFGNRPPDDELLVRYLLGTLAEPDAEPLDERSIADDEFALRLRAVENDLIDSYARGELTGPRRGQFEAAYLESPHRRERVAFARALAAVQPERRASWFDRVPAAVPRYVYAAAALVLALAAIYLVFEHRRREQEVQTPRTVRLEPPPPSAPPGTTPNTSAPPARGRATPNAPRTVFTFSVPAIATRGADDKPLTIAAGTTHVTLNLEGDAPPTGVVHIVVRTVSGRTVWEGSGERGGSGVLTRVTIPADVLRPDDYLAIASTPAPDATELWRYSFRVAAAARR
jgi:hypothetical protein